MRRALLVPLVLAGCVERGPGDPGERVDPEVLAEGVLDQVPDDIARRVDVTFTTPDGGEVRYLGIDVVEGEQPPAPGDDVELIHYWQVIEPPGPGWRIFTHVEGAHGDFVNADDSELRRGHPVAAWKPGQILRDHQVIALEPTWKTKTASVKVGLFQVCCRRIEDRAAAAEGGAAVAGGAVEVARFTVDVGRKPPPPPPLAIRKATAPITLDGAADEPAWKRAASVSAFEDIDCGASGDGTTEAKLTWDDQHLYVWVSTDDPDVFSPYTERDDTLWSKADVIEMFIDADRSKRGYIELQVNPRNVQFDTWLEGGRGSNVNGFDAKMASAVAVRGTVDERGDGDVGWSVELAIPHAAVKGEDPDMKVNVPPQPGDIWKVNVLAADYRKDGSTILRSWARITCADWHGVDALIEVQFADAAGAVTPRPSAEPPPPKPAEPPEPPGPVEAPAAKPPEPTTPGAIRRKAVPVPEKAIAPR